MIVMVLVTCYALFYAVMGGALILRAFGLWGKVIAGDDDVVMAEIEVSNG